MEDLQSKNGMEDLQSKNGDSRQKETRCLPLSQIPDSVSLLLAFIGALEGSVIEKAL